jgi:hypothetical protein
MNPIHQPTSTNPNYRIVEHHHGNGNVSFEPQKRFLFWWSGWTKAANEFEFSKMTFKTIDEAREFCRKDSAPNGYYKTIQTA